MLDQGYITPGASTTRYTPRSRSRSPNQIQPPAENSSRPYFTSWLRQQLVDRYGAGEAFGGGLQIKSTLDLDLQREVEGDRHSRHSPGSSRPRRSSCSTTTTGGGAGDGRRPRLPGGAVQPGDQRPPPAGLGVQAVHAGHRARAGPLAGRDVSSRRPRRSRSERRSRRRTATGEGRPRDLQGQQLQRLLPRHRLDRSPRPPTPTTPSTRSSAPRSASENVAATAQAMGIETDLSTAGIEYSINGGPLEPYNPALILGGLQTGVSPLEMAHAYDTLQEDGDRVSGTMAADAGGPVGILERHRRRRRVDEGADCTGGQVPDQTGADGVNETITKQVIDPAVAADRQGRALDRGHLRNRQARPDGRPHVGQDRDHRQQRRRLVLRRDRRRSPPASGSATPNSVTPMETEFAGAPVDGGTFPAADLRRRRERLRRARGGTARRSEDTSSDSSPRTRPPSSPTTAAPTTTSAAPATSHRQRAPDAGERRRRAPRGGRRPARAAPSSAGGVSPG